MISIRKSNNCAASVVARGLLCIVCIGCRSASLEVVHRGDTTVINFIIWLLFGALVGWLASIVMRTDAQQGALLNIIVGIIGAFLGGFLASALGFSGSNINNNDFSLSGLLVAFIGAVVLLGIVNLVRRGSVR